MTEKNALFPDGYYKYIVYKVYWVENKDTQVKYIYFKTGQQTTVCEVKRFLFF